MSIQLLQKYLPENTLPFLKSWFGDHYIHIKITKGRNSKLGDYRKLPDKSHLITVNSTLDPQLFFFVLTHELAHLLAFEKYGRRIAPHGNEWKQTYREMLLESLSIYSDDLKPIIIKFSHSPKANFMARPDLVRYFHMSDLPEHLCFVEDLTPHNTFKYNKQRYRMIEKLKKNYLCENLDNGKKYIFKSLAKVEKINS